MDDDSTMKLCRTCGKKNFIFCDVQHEVLQKLTTFVPSLVSRKHVLSTRNLLEIYKKLKLLEFSHKLILNTQHLFKL